MEAILERTDIEEKVKEFNENCRPANQPALKPGEWYALFPENQSKDDALGWPDDYPDGNKPGVYVVFNKDKKVLYIGKASMWNSMVSRLAAYFTYFSKEDRKCKVRSLESWSAEPHFLITIPVDINRSYEAAALEEYLIKEFRGKLPDNTIGK